MPIVSETAQVLHPVTVFRCQCSLCRTSAAPARDIGRAFANAREAGFVKIGDLHLCLSCAATYSPQARSVADPEEA